MKLDHYQSKLNSLCDKIDAYYKRMHSYDYRLAHYGYNKLVNEADRIVGKILKIKSRPK
jgi:hypothetical protein